MCAPFIPNMKQDKSDKIFEAAKGIFPGGVNSPVRAFGAVGGDPPFIKQAKGSRLTDLDGNRYIDYVLSWGPLIFGHADPAVVAAISKTAALGTSFGAPTAREVRLAEWVQSFFPTMERLRFVNSGTEATMSAIRLARGWTGRDKIVKFEGGYHGHVDSLLVKAGSGVATFGLPDSAGVPADLARLTITVPFNDLAAFQKVVETEGSKIAAVIVEPVPGNMGVVVPAPGFLPGLRELTRPFGIVLIFDEVMSGFRVAPGGAQERYGVRPDLTCLGKIIGGGLPVGAYGGRREIMEQVAPLGPVYQAGTLSGNPLAMSAGIATLERLKDPKVYERLETASATLCDGLLDAARAAKIPVQINRVGSQMTLFFAEQAVTSHATARLADTKRYATFFRAMLERGVYLPPSQFEAFFLSTAHTASDLQKTLAAAREAFKALLSRGGYSLSKTS